jgi:hypothetical protein
LCNGCFDAAFEQADVGRLAVFASPASGLCSFPEEARCISGLPQKTPDQVEKVFAMFRELSVDDIRKLALEIPFKARVGDCLEFFGPVSWWSVLRCLEWLRAIHDIGLRHLFGRWEKLPSILAKNLVGPDYEPWRVRIGPFAEGEFVFRYNVLLSDAIEGASRKAALSKTPAAKRKALEACKAAVCSQQPPASLNGVDSDLRRFADYMDDAISRCDTG